MLLGQEQRIEQTMRESQEIVQNQFLAQLMLILKMLRNLRLKPENNLQVETDQELNNQLEVQLEEAQFNQLTVEADQPLPSLRIEKDGKEILLVVSEGEKMEVRQINSEELSKLKDLQGYFTQEGEINQDLKIEVNNKILLETQEGKITQNSLLSGLSEAQVDEIIQNLHALEAEKVLEANDGEYNPARQNQLQNVSLSLLGQLQAVVTTLEQEAVVEGIEGKTSLRVIEETREELTSFFSGKLKERELQERNTEEYSEKRQKKPDKDTDLEQ